MSKNSNSESAVFSDLLAERLPAASGYEKGFRDALESMSLVMNGLGVSYARIMSEMTEVLDAYSNNAEKNCLDVVDLTLSVTDADGIVVDSAPCRLTPEQITTIVDAASELALAHRSGKSGARLLESAGRLDEALTVTDVLGPDNQSLKKPLVSVIDLIAQADDEFESYLFGDDVSVAAHSVWDASDPCDLTKIVFIEDRWTAGTNQASSDEVFFHTRFNALGEVSEVYALLSKSGGLIGERGLSAANIARQKAISDEQVQSDEDVGFVARGHRPRGQ